MDLGDLGDFLADTLEFDLGGRHYIVPPVAWPVYLDMMKTQEHLVAVSQGTAKAEDGPEDRPIWETSETALGPVFQELVDAGVAGPTICYLGRAAYMFQIGRGDAAALLLQGKVPTPAPASGSTSTTPTGSTPSVSGSGTKRRASTTGTRSRTTSRKPSQSTKRQPAATG